MTNGEAGSLFCTVGGNQLTVYSANKDKTTSPLLCFIDQEADESYYCCAWLVDSGTGDLLIAVGGIKSSIKVVNCNTNSLHQHLVGHGNSINHLCAHPIDADILFSASKDESIRMWNVRNGKVLAMFAGDCGHRDEVLCIDVHRLGRCFLSSGMDHSIKIWALDNETVKSAIAKKNDTASKGVCFQESPVYSTCQVHTDYVDCVKWVGDFIISKSISNQIVMWKPCTQRRTDA
jgi:polycomb protein EED